MAPAVTLQAAGPMAASGGNEARPPRSPTRLAGVVAIRIGIRRRFDIFAPPYRRSLRARHESPRFVVLVFFDAAFEITGRRIDRIAYAAPRTGAPQDSRGESTTVACTKHVSDTQAPKSVHGSCSKCATDQGSLRTLGSANWPLLLRPVFGSGGLRLEAANDGEHARQRRSLACPWRRARSGRLTTSALRPPKAGNG